MRRQIARLSWFECNRIRSADSTAGTVRVLCGVRGAGVLIRLEEIITENRQPLSLRQRFGLAAIPVGLFEFANVQIASAPVPLAAAELYTPRPGLWQAWYEKLLL